MATDSVARAIALAAKANSGKPGPAGPKGDDGLAATIQVGTVTTGAAGTNAEVTNVGTENAAIFNFTIPKGDTGEAGSGGLSTIVAGTGTSSIVMNHNDTNTNVASGNYSTALGYGTKAAGQGALAAGYSQTPGRVVGNEKGAIAMGAAGGSARGGVLAETSNITASGRGAFAGGAIDEMVVSGTNATIEATGLGSFAYGYGQSNRRCAANGDGSAAFGHSQATGEYSFTFGQGRAEGAYSFVGGVGSNMYQCPQSNTYGAGSLVVGYATGEMKSDGKGQWIGGYGSCYATGEGAICYAIGGEKSTVGVGVSVGQGIKNSANNCTAIGKHNIEPTQANEFVIVVGSGESNTNRANAFTLDWTGNATFAGTVTSASGADYAEYFEWKDGNKDSEDRVGYIVTLDGDKIVKAKNGDDILGIISGCATVIGDNAEWNWQGRFERDEFGRIIYDQVEQFIDTPDPDWEPNPEKPDEEVPMIKKSLGYFPVPRENADYDPTKEYTNRSNRPEWDTVGMMGKLYVRDDGTAAINDYVTVSATTDGVATKAEGRTSMRVMERVNDHIIRVCFK